MKNIIYLEYASLAELPDEVWGFLDWSTGFLRVNINEKIWYEEVWPNELLETITHELFHSFQISLCGYMNNFSIKLLKIISEIIPHPISDINHTFNNIDDLDTTLLNKHLKELDLKNEENISIRCLIESMAYFMHKRNIDANLSHNKYMQLLNSSVYDEYRSTYFFLENIIGEKVFIIFEKVLFTSLCFVEPVKIFMEISKALSILEHALFEETDYINFIINQTETLHKKGFAYYSSPVVYSNKLNITPFFKDSISKLSGKISMSDNILMKILSDMDKLFDEYLLESFRPVFFNKEKDYIPVLLPKQFNNLNGVIEIDSMNDEANVMLGISLLSFKLLSKNANVNYLRLK